eukprot:COSAG01_NODE_909_length_12785_cov_4.201876_1_plen_252_part_00
MSSGGVRSTRRPCPHSACPVLCGWHLMCGDGRVRVGISSWAEEVRLGIVQPPQLGGTPPHPPGRPRRGGRSVCAGQVRRLRGPGTSRHLTTGGARTTIATGSPPQLRHLLRPPCGIQGGDFQAAGGGGIGLASEGTKCPAGATRAGLGCGSVPMGSKTTENTGRSGMARSSDTPRRVHAPQMAPVLVRRAQASVAQEGPHRRLVTPVYRCHKPSHPDRWRPRSHPRWGQQRRLHPAAAPAAGPVVATRADG